MNYHLILASNSPRRKELLASHHRKVYIVVAQPSADHTLRLQAVHQLIELAALRRGERSMSNQISEIDPYPVMISSTCLRLYW